MLSSKGVDELYTHMTCRVHAYNMDIVGLYYSSISYTWYDYAYLKKRGYQF